MILYRKNKWQHLTSNIYNILHVNYNKLVVLHGYPENGKCTLNRLLEVILILLEGLTTLHCLLKHVAYYKIFEIFLTHSRNWTDTRTLSFSSLMRFFSLSCKLWLAVLLKWWRRRRNAIITTNNTTNVKTITTPRVTGNTKSFVTPGSPVIPMTWNKTVNWNIYRVNQKRMIHS